MSDFEEFDTLQKEYLIHFNDKNAKLKYACVLIRRSKREEKQTGLRILYDLYREYISPDTPADQGIDASAYRTILYYLAVANYRLGYFEESKRFATTILKT